MRRKKQTFGYWEEELRYIKRRVEINDFSSFDNDPECFKRYVEMQARHASEDGFDDLARQMRAALWP